MLHLSGLANAPLQVNAGVTTYFLPGQTYGVNNSATESNNQIAWRTTGSFSLLYCRLSVNNSTGTSSVVFRKNTAAGNQSIAIGPLLSGEFSDSTDIDTNQAGDLIAFQVTAGGGGAIGVALLAFQFVSSVKTVTRYASSLGVSFTGGSVTRYTPTAGNAYTLAETAVQFKVEAPLVWQNLQVNVSANTRIDINTLKSRVNTANGNQAVSVPATTTGIFEDLSDTDILAAGALIDYQLATGTDNAHSITWQSASSELSSSAQQGCFIAGTAASNTIGPSVTHYLCACGISGDTATEANAQVRPNFAAMLAHLELYIVANGITAASTFAFRKNTGYGNQSISVGSSASGYFEDALDQDSFNAGDEIDYSLTAGASGSSIQYSSFGSLATATFFVAQFIPDCPTIIIRYQDYIY